MCPPDSQYDVKKFRPKQRHGRGPMRLIILRNCVSIRPTSKRIASEYTFEFETLTLKPRCQRREHIKACSHDNNESNNTLNGLIEPLRIIFEFECGSLVI